MPPLNRFAIKLLGGLSVSTDRGRIETFPTKRSAMILCLVALSRKGMIARDELAERLWPEDYLDATRQRLRQELKRLRTALEDASEIIDSDRNWVKIDFELVEVDNREFERNLQLAKVAESTDRELQLLERAITVYDGPLLPEFHEEWALTIRAELQNKYIDALARASSLAADAGDRMRAIELATLGFRAEPIRGTSTAQLMMLQIEAAQIESANATLNAHARALEKSEMGRPSSDLLSLLQSAPTPVISKSTSPKLAPQSHLPKYFDLFCGRSHELNLIGQLLLAERGPRLITLTGPGGVGKTRLSVEIADEHGPELSGVLFFSLEGINTTDISDRIAEEVAARSPGLVILDNAETHLEEGIQIVKRLRSDRPQLRIIVTSRLPLRISGEQLIPIEPLSMPIYALELDELSKNESVRLFENRVQALNPNFRIDSKNASDVVRLLSQLDGLPLASEIAASGVASFGLRRVSEQIDHRLTELVSNRVDVPDRHRSLSAAIEWSYQELSTHQQHVLQTLATLNQGGSASLVEQLVGQENIGVVQQLCEKSLVTRSEDLSRPRFRLLSSISLFVSQQVDEIDHNDHRRQHAHAINAWLGTVLPAARVFTQDHWHQLDEEQENILSAITWAQSNHPDLALKIVDQMWRYWPFYGSLRTGQETLQNLLDTPGLDRSPLLARVIHAYSVILYNSRKFEKCSAVLDDLEKLAEELDEKFLLITSRAMHGVVAMDLADYERAYHSARACWKGYSELPGYEVDAMISRATMARNAGFLGWNEEAITEMEAVFAERLRRSIPFETARGYRELAEVYRETGKDPHPVALQEKSLSLYRNLTARPWLLACLFDLHSSYLAIGRFEDAQKLEVELETLMEKTDSSTVLAEIRLAQAHRFLLMEDPLSAKRLLSESLEIAVQEGHVPLLLGATLIAAQLLLTANQPEKSARLAAHIRLIHREKRGGLMASQLRELEALEALVQPVILDQIFESPTALGARALGFLIG